MFSFFLLALGGLAVREAVAGSSSVRGRERPFFSFFLVISIVIQHIFQNASTFYRRDNPINPGFPYGSQTVRGMNLGGWLVLEV